MAYYGPEWDHELVSMSARLRNVFEVTGARQGIRQSAAVCILAEQLNLDPERLRTSSRVIVSRLLPGLEEMLAAGGSDWTEDYDGNAKVIVERATQGLDREELIAAVEEFGWGKNREIPPHTTWGNLANTARDLVNSKLSLLVFRMLQGWRARDAWNPDLELGIITARGAKSRP